MHSAISGRSPQSRRRQCAPRRPPASPRKALDFRNLDLPWRRLPQNWADMGHLCIIVFPNMHRLILLLDNSSGRNL